MIYKYLSFSIAITFISFIVGLLINAILKKTNFYNKHSSNLNFIKSKKVNQFIRIYIFKWIVKNTFFKYLNQRLKLKNKIDRSDLIQLRNDMTSSEIDHLIGFAFVTVFAVIKSYQFNLLFGLTIMLVNTFMNLYPSLLQQENKRRIDQFIRRIN